MCHWISISWFSNTGCLWRTAATKGPRRVSRLVIQRSSNGFTMLHELLRPSYVLKNQMFRTHSIDHKITAYRESATGWASGFQPSCCISFNSKGCLIPYIIRTKILLDFKMNLRVGCSMPPRRAPPHSEWPNKPRTPLRADAPDLQIAKEILCAGSCWSLRFLKSLVKDHWPKGTWDLSNLVCLKEQINKAHSVLLAQCVYNHLNQGVTSL